MYIRVAMCHTLSCQSKTTNRAKMIVPVVSSIRVVSCQPCHGSRAVPAVLGLALKRTTSVVVCSVPGCAS